jgi:hypothetical protein
MPPPRRQDPEAVDLAGSLSSLELVPVKLAMPRPVELGLEQLVIDLMTRARRLGKVNRGELVGALLLRALERPEDLPGAVEVFRDAKVHEVLLTKPGMTGLMRLPRRLRGRPTRRV